MDSILKVIRTQIEARRREKDQNVLETGGGSISQSSRGVGGPYGGISSTGTIHKPRGQLDFEL